MDPMPPCLGTWTLLGLLSVSQVDALEDQKNRLTNGLEKLHATSEQARQYEELLSGGDR